MTTPEFILIPYQLLADKRVTPVEERVYGIVYWLSKLRNERCTASNTTLAELCKTTTGTVQNALTHLEELGYICRKFADEERRIRIEIIPLVVFAKVSPTPDTYHPQVTQVSPTGDRGYHPQVNRRITTKQEKKEYTPGGLSTDGKAFEDFWNSYPRKIGRQDAWRAWTKLRPSPALRATILEAVRKQKTSGQWTKDAGRYIPHPATWLNGNRWEDQLDVINERKVDIFK